MNNKPLTSTNESESSSIATIYRGCIAALNQILLPNWTQNWYGASNRRDIVGIHSLQWLRIESSLTHQKRWANKHICMDKMDRALSFWFRQITLLIVLSRPNPWPIHIDTFLNEKCHGLCKPCHNATQARSECTDHRKFKFYKWLIWTFCHNFSPKNPLTQTLTFSRSVALSRRETVLLLVDQNVVGN